MKLLIAEPASRDLENIIDFIALDNPAAARQIYRSIVSSAGRLTKIPYMGRAGRLAGTREFSISKLPYLLVYEISENAITILAVFHSSRNLAKAFEERQNEIKSSGPQT